MGNIRKHRPFVRYSLRTAFFFLTVLSLLLGYLTVKVREQRESVGIINQHGGTVGYDYEADINPTQSFPGSSFVRQYFGHEYFQQVVSIDLSKSEVSDSDLRLISRLGRARTMLLNETKITDQGLLEIPRMSELRRVELSGTKVTSEGIRVLGSLPSLNRVSLADTGIDDQAVSSLVNCEELNLDGTLITSKGIALLSASSTLTRLSLRHTQIDDSSVSALLTLRSLQFLDVVDSKLSGKGLYEVHKGLPACRLVGAWAEISAAQNRNKYLSERLRCTDFILKMERTNKTRPFKLLILDSQHIDDVHLSMLAGFKDLDAVDVRGAIVTDKGINKIKRVIPNLEVIR
jgi:hypothetical protein